MALAVKLDTDMSGDADALRYGRRRPVHCKCPPGDLRPENLKLRLQLVFSLLFLQIVARNQPACKDGDPKRPRGGVGGVGKSGVGAEGGPAEEKVQSKGRKGEGRGSGGDNKLERKWTLTAKRPYL